MQKGLVVEDKADRVKNYRDSMNYEVGVIAHSCGCRRTASVGSPPCKGGY
ncbi:MAG: hypothetical protein ACNYPE_12820 [Candidatus Azotimanducaceae bacterium WSBS_2022_MAG_OTU7]